LIRGFGKKPIYSDPVLRGLSLAKGFESCQSESFPNPRPRISLSHRITSRILMQLDRRPTVVERRPTRVLSGRPLALTPGQPGASAEIGRASCREGVWIAEVAGGSEKR